jgi:deoxyribodipyrimidine photolyase-related protein
MRHLVIVLGDQLDADATAWEGFDPAQDIACMAEAVEESTHVWSSQPRIAVFLAAMRHFAAGLRGRGVPLDYTALPDAPPTLREAFTAAIARHRPGRLVVTHPGEWRVLQMLRELSASTGVPLDVREDRHFLCSTADFAAHARGRKQLRMEFFYREQRRRHRVLMDGEEPAGGRWNFDPENRAAFGREGPGLLVPPLRFEPDAITREVIALVRERFADHPGRLDDFVRNRLAAFGHWQDAMWTGEPFLHHALLSSALNLKLLDPRTVLGAVEDAWRRGEVPLASAEGFIRQILGWREYVRGIYWLRMPQYLDLNELAARQELPWFYWTGETDMNCLREAIGQTLALGYAHHIQRLMVTGLFALLLGVRPQAVHAWYLAVYVDAVEWVELPNTLGMSQYGDGGLLGSKPYVASGRYIDRMSNYCGGCRYDPAKRTGEDACPFTTLYWDFLARHGERLQGNQRMRMQLKNLQALEAGERRAIGERAARIRAGDLFPPPPGAG